LPDTARDPTTRLYVTSQVLCEFYSIIANPHRGAPESHDADADAVTNSLNERLLKESLV
jgi:hypothetical protein